ncbi:hypothetical protein [Nissabacter sp. SGAir0207]|uniref:hypothetical protein n=1 Tax=Nissabacter sp. SGAir0207 TaxID=2126321 RepID=UPI0010CD07ED|nr:hypothetical protein [Nissabacter sp. SGAir0207]QCR38943.1 hypothetical protein C1N62_22775 [Nissabacter sp. SGAir0207]
MANRFDFEIRADDQVSEALKNIDEQVRNLQPGLEQTTDRLKLGGQETHDGLSGVNQAFDQLGRFARQNVQFIGDMVPPLRTFTGHAGKLGGLAGKLGLAGGAAYLAGKSVSSLGSEMSEASDDAYALQTAAQNAGLSVETFSRMSGAMRLLGTDSASAKQSIEGLYKTFNDGLQGRNSAVVAAMNMIHAPIVKAADGTADVAKTMERLAEIFPTLSANRQKTLADGLGLNDAQLQLLREGARYKQLLAKSDAVGLTVDPKVTQQLVDFNRATTEAGAAWDGFKQRIEQRIQGKLLSNGTVTSGIRGFTDILEHGLNPISASHALGFNVGSEADMMRRAQHDKAFQATLTPFQRNRLKWGFLPKQDEAKYRLYYGLRDQANQLLADTQAATTAAAPLPGSAKVDPTALSVVNNNPWNLRYAGQAGAMPGAGDNFARFATPQAGVENADRQLMLYYTGESRNVDHPLRTLNEIINKASPRTDGNNTSRMVQAASHELNIDPHAQLNLDDVGMRSRVLAALFNQEGNNPFNAVQIESILQQRNGGVPTGVPAPAPLIPPESQPAPLVTPPLLTTAAAPAQPGQQPQAPGNGDPVALQRAFEAAMKETGMKIELTLVNPQTGQQQTFTGRGSKVATAMQFP